MLSKRVLCLALIALLLAAAALAIVHFAAMPQQTDEPVSEETAYTMLYEEALADFTGMTVTVQGQEPYTVRSDMVYDETGTLLGVRNSLAQPLLLTGDESFRFSAYAYQMLLLAAQHIPVTTTIARNAAGSLSAYGLDAPSVRLDMRYGASRTRTLMIGRLTPSGTGCYVLCDDTDIGVAPYDLYQALTGGLNAMHTLPATLGYTADQVTGLSIQRAGQTLVEIALKDESSREASVIPYEQRLPFTHDVNTARLQTVLDGLCSAVPERYAGRASTDAQRASYGLAQPTLTLTAIIQNQYMAQLVIGADASDGSVYCTIDRSGDVYLLSRDKLAFADNAVPEFLLEQAVSLISVTQVSGVTLARGGAEHVLTPLWDDTADSPYAKEYLVDGAPMPREDWTRLYAEIIGLTFDKVATVPFAGEPELTVRFALKNGETVDQAFYAHDEHYSSVVRNGTALFLIRREKVESLISRWFD